MKTTRMTNLFRKLTAPRPHPAAPMTMSKPLNLMILTLPWGLIQVFKDPVLQACLPILTPFTGERCERAALWLLMSSLRLGRAGTSDEPTPRPSEKCRYAPVCSEMMAVTSDNIRTISMIIELVMGLRLWNVRQTESLQ